MLRLGILGLGVVAAMVVFNCGGRTPVEDDELFGAAGSGISTGSAGASATGPGGSVIIGGTGGTTIVGTGFGGTSSTGTGMGGTSSTGTGMAGTIIVGTGGSTGSSGSSGTGGSVVGTGGFSGTGGAVGMGGSVGTGGAAGGGNPVRQLVASLPATRPNNDCVGCASRCPGSAQCAANPACAQGLACAVANCGMGMGGGCFAMCFGNNPQTYNQAIAALSCVYQTCGRQCIVGRMR